MASRGVPFHADSEQAFQAALKRIRTYKGSQPVFDMPTRELIQGIVIDSLIVAPQPVTGGWVHTSLMAVGGLVRWAAANGEDLEREQLLSHYMRERFLHLGTSHLEATSRRNYRCRLDLIATALSGVPIVPTTPASRQQDEATDPHDDMSVASIWVWANGLRPEKRRQRVTAAMTLALGCGLRAGEVATVKTTDIVVDDHGVHLQVHDRNNNLRTVTCDAVWEERLLDLLDRTPTGRPISTPWNAEPVSARSLQNVLASAQHAQPAAEWFSITSLRNTWIVQHLTQGTPVPVLLDAAGLESIEALKPLLPYVPEFTDEQRAAILRDGAR